MFKDKSTLTYTFAFNKKTTLLIWWSFIFFTHPPFTVQYLFSTSVTISL